MGRDTIRVLRFVFVDIWSLFTSWHIPGTNFSPAAWAMFSLWLFVLVRFLRNITGSQGSDKDK